MISKDTSFAKWSRPTCWVVAAVCLLIAMVTITGDSSNAMLLGLLWLAGAVAFGISGFFIGKSVGKEG